MVSPSKQPPAGRDSEPRRRRTRRRTAQVSRLLSHFGGLDESRLRVRSETPGTRLIESASSSFVATQTQLKHKQTQTNTNKHKHKHIGSQWRDTKLSSSTTRRPPRRRPKHKVHCVRDRCRLAEINQTGQLEARLGHQNNNLIDPQKSPRSRMELHERLFGGPINRGRGPPRETGNKKQLDLEPNNSTRPTPAPYSATPYSQPDYLLQARARRRGRRKWAPLDRCPPGWAALLLIGALVAGGVAKVSATSPLAATSTTGADGKPTTASNLLVGRLDELPDLASETSDEPVLVVAGQEAYLSCVAKNLQNYTIIWRFSPDTPTSGASSNSSSPNSSAADSAGAGAEEEEQGGVILTAGRQRVSSDERFSVVQSHGTWLLRVRQVRPSDAGAYTCETNSRPRVRAIRLLRVTGGGAAGQVNSSWDSDQLEADERRLQSKLLGQRPGEPAAELQFDFSACCRDEFVAPRCQRLCHLSELASQFRSMSLVHECYSQLPSIGRCMVAGRNLTECCHRRQVPRRCHQLCGRDPEGGGGSISVQDQAYCADYSASIMSCVAEGVESLPSRPELVVVEASSESQLRVSWERVTDERELRNVQAWQVRLDKLSSFEDTPPRQPNSTRSTPTDQPDAQVSERQFQAITKGTTNGSLAPPEVGGWLETARSKVAAIVQVDKAANELTLDQLRPFTVYQVQVFAWNERGRSQPSEPIRALTLAPSSQPPSSSQDAPAEESLVEPSLPDTRRCCQERGVTLRRCLDTLCDPVEADKATIADLMICAPWSNATFGCLSGGRDHSECCRARGVSPFCQSMCSGQVKRVDHRHFRCLSHMSAYSNCVLESHNVLPGPPHNFSVGPITSAWAVLNWRPPTRNRRSLQGYRIFWRRVEGGGSNSSSNSSSSSSSSSSSQVSDELFFASAEAAANPYLLDDLQPDTAYETFAVAVNRFGQSESSARFVFQTLAAAPATHLSPLDSPSAELRSRLPLHQNQPDSEPERRFYNETSCCVGGGLSASCLQLCSYHIKVEDAAALVSTCSSQMPLVVRCLAGQRNSVPCCRNRGVSDQCLNVCAGLTEHSPLVLATRCGPDLGKVIRCMDEGSKQIPGAPLDLHTLEVTPRQVRLQWRPAPEDQFRADLEYHVRYQQLTNRESAGSPDDSPAADPATLVAVVPLHPLEHNQVRSTNSTQLQLDQLAPNSRYSLYVTAENSYGISLPSLVLVLQTPPQLDSSGADRPAGAADYQRQATLGAPHSLELLRSDTDSLALRWQAPLYLAADSALRYRVFYKPLQLVEDKEGVASSNSSGDAPASWSVVETRDSQAVLRNLRYASQYVVTVQAADERRRGHMSELLIGQTARPVPPSLERPLVIGQPVEGANVTVMCVALGSPTPQISMFINGLLVQKRTQPYAVYHLVHLARGQLTISCFATNGQGRHQASVQSRAEISVRFGARARALAKQVRAAERAQVRLTCQLSGNPLPSVVWSFKAAASQAEASPASSAVIAPDERVTSQLIAQPDDPFAWSLTLTLRNLTSSDLGAYTCHARNPLAEASDTLELLPAAAAAESAAAETDPPSDLLDCCKSQNITEACLPVCSSDGLDVTRAFATAACEPHLDRLMLCAADGSDHRNCCRARQVLPTCWRWCTGARLPQPGTCLLSAALDIVGCFQEGRSLLPGPPRRLSALLARDSPIREQVESAPELPVSNRLLLGPPSGAFEAGPSPVETATSAAPTSTEPPQPVLIQWEPPSKNPAQVQYYRIFWRAAGSRDLSRAHTNLTWIRLDRLEPGRSYEFVVKAANHHGSSVYSEPLLVRPAELVAQSLLQSSLGSASLIWFTPSPSSAGHLLWRILTGALFATLFMLGSLALVITLERRGHLRRFASSKSNSSRISFANPAYSNQANQVDELSLTKQPTAQNDATRSSWLHDLSSGHSLDVLTLPRDDTPTS